MHRLKTFLIALPVVLALLVGGVWGYLWYNTKQQLDEFIKLVKPFADISYRGIDVSLAGSITVNRIRAIIEPLNDAVSIGSMRLNTPNLLALLDISTQLRSGHLPNALGLSMEDLEISLDGGILGASEAARTHRSPFSDLDALGCGPIQTLSGTEWQEMGYRNMVSNVTWGYRLTPAYDALELQIDSDTRDWAALNFRIGFAISPPTSSIIGLTTSLSPKITQLQVAIRDLGFNERRNNYCAAKAGKPVEAYLADHVRLVAQHLQANGLQLGGGLVDAYRQSLANGSQLAINASPPIPVDLRELQFYKPDDIKKLLGLAVKVNEQPVNDLTLQWDATKIAQALAVKSEPESTAEATSPATAKPEPKPDPVVQKSYQPIPISELSRYIGTVAKIKMINNASYNGILDTVSSEMVIITIRKGSGKATLSLRRSDISEVQILQ